MEAKNRIFFFVVICILLLSYFVILFKYELVENVYSSNNIGDVPSYLLAGKNLYSEFKFDINRPFGYPLIIGFPNLFNCGDRTISSYIFVFQFLCWLASGLILYKIIQGISNSKLAVFGIVLYALNFSPIYYSTVGLTETVFTLCLLITIYWYKYFLDTKNVKFLLLFALFIFISSVIKPITLYLSWGAFIIIIYVLTKQKEKRLKNILILFVFFLSTIGLQYYGVYRTNNTWEFSNIGKGTLYRYQCSYAEALERNISIEKAQNERDSILQSQTGDINEFVSRNIKDKLLSSTLYMLEAYFLSLYSNAIVGSEQINPVKSNTSYNWITMVQNICYTIILIFTILINLILISVKKRYRTRTFRFLFLCSILCGYLWLLSGISFWQGDRFIIILYPIIIIMLISLIYFLREHKKVVE